MHFSVCLALVHNNNQLRNDYTRPKIEELISNMDSHVLVKRIEVSYQSEIVPQSFAMAFMRDVIYQNLGSKWRRYRLLKSRKFRSAVNFFRASFVKYILN